MTINNKNLKKNSFEIWAFDAYVDKKTKRNELMVLMSDDQWEKYSDFEQEIGVGLGYLPIKYNNNFYRISWKDWGEDGSHILYVYYLDTITKPKVYYELKDKKLIFKGNKKGVKDEKNV